MSFHRISVQNYIHASEDLLKSNQLDKLSDDEMVLIAKMLHHLSETLLDAGQDGKP